MLSPDEKNMSSLLGTYVIKTCLPWHVHILYIMVLRSQGLDLVREPINPHLPVHDLQMRLHAACEDRFPSLLSIALVAHLAAYFPKGHRCFKARCCGFQHHNPQETKTRLGSRIHSQTPVHSD